MGIHTLHIEHVVLLAVYTLLTVANSWLYKGMKGIHWFSLYNLFALLGAIAVALRGVIPDFCSIVLGNLFVVVGYTLLFLSLSALLDFPKRQFHLQTSLAAVAVVTMLQYGWLHPDTRRRLICYSVVLGLQQAQIAWLVVQQRGGGFRIAGGTMALMLAGLSLANAVRVTGVFLQGAPADYLNAGPFLAWIVVINSCLQCGTMVAYVWITAALLRNDLEVQASTDPLTGLFNRRAFERRAEIEIANCRSAEMPISAITIDLDGFKQLNDTYGHACGDAMLVIVAKCLRQNMRKTDLVARLGGDEFAVLLPRTPLEDAFGVAEDLRASLERLQLASGEIHSKVTASFGLAEAERQTANWDHLVMHCDQALYAAKRRGGNRVMQEGGVDSRQAVMF